MQFFFTEIQQNTWRQSSLTMESLSVIDEILGAHFWTLLEDIVLNVLGPTIQRNCFAYLNTFVLFILLTSWVLVSTHSGGSFWSKSKDQEDLSHISRQAVASESDGWLHRQMWTACFYPSPHTSSNSRCIASKLGKWEKGNWRRSGGTRETCARLAASHIAPTHPASWQLTCHHAPTSGTPSHLQDSVSSLNIQQKNRTLRSLPDQNEICTIVKDGGCKVRRARQNLAEDWSRYKKRGIIWEIVGYFLFQCKVSLKQ